MGRRSFLGFCFCAALARAAAKAAVRGRLKPPALITREGKRIILEGDEDTLKVVNDLRVAKEDFEATGELVANDRFRIDPIYKRALFVWRNGKRLAITYWCDTCGIRTYVPGKCVCCQQETQLDPREPEA